MKSERDNQRWQKQGLWHYVESHEKLHPFGFWVTRGERTWRFWCLTPSAAYWLAANLNEHLIGESIAHADARTKAYRKFAKAAAEVRESAQRELAGEIRGLVLT